MQWGSACGGGGSSWDHCGLVAGWENHPCTGIGGASLLFCKDGHGHMQTPPSWCTENSCSPPLSAQAEKEEKTKTGRVGRRKALFTESKNHSKGPVPWRTGLRIKGVWRFHLPEQPTQGALMETRTPVSCLGEGLSHLYPWLSALTLTVPFVVVV